MAEEWDGNEIGLVAEVDCTTKLGKLLCEQFNIQSFPTLMYGHPHFLEEYNGGRSFEELSEFAQENLVPICSPSDLDKCDDETRKQLEEYMALSAEDLRARIVEEETKLKEAKQKYEDELAALQEKYDEAANAKEEAIQAVKDGGFEWMKAIEKARRGSPQKIVKGVQNEEL